MKSAAQPNADDSSIPQSIYTKEEASSTPLGSLSMSPSRSSPSPGRVQQLLFRKLVTLMDANESKSKAKTLGEQEVSHLYSILKVPALKAQLQPKQRQDLTKKCMKTLEQLMGSLLLQEDYKALVDAHKKALRAEENEKRVRIMTKAQLEERECDRLIKFLLRCQKMYEAKQETCRILVRAKAREEQMNSFLDTLASRQQDELKDSYDSILKASCKLYNRVERMRVDNPLLNRPFMYNGQNLQSNLLREQLNIRDLVIKKHGTAVESLVDSVLDKAGRIVRHDQLPARDNKSKSNGRR